MDNSLDAISKGKAMRGRDPPALYAVQIEGVEKGVLDPGITENQAEHQNGQLGNCYTTEREDQKEESFYSSFDQDYNFFPLFGNHRKKPH